MKIKRILALILSMSLIMSAGVFADGITDGTDGSDGDGVISPAVPVTFAVTVDATEGCTVAATDSNGDPVADLSAIPLGDNVITLTATVTDAEANEFDKWQKKVDGVFVDVADEDETWDITVTENIEVKALIKAKTIVPTVTAPSASVVTINYATETVKYDETLYVVTKADKTTVVGSHDPSVTGDPVEADERIAPGTKIYVREVSADPANNSLWTEISLPARPAMSYAESIYYENASYGNVNDGVIKNLTVGVMEYQSNNDPVWRIVNNASLFYLAPDTYYIRMCATLTSFASENKIITISRKQNSFSSGGSSGNNFGGSLGEKYYSNNGKYSMSASAPITSAQQNTAVKATFADIETHWAKANIVRAVEKGMFNGVAENTFDPEGTTTRGMIITVIARMNGVDLSGYKTSSFADVAAGEWYAAAIEWGNEKGIVTGTGGSNFDPNGLLTREQIATIIYRYATAVGKDTSAKADISGFADYTSVSEYAADAFAWANSAGIVTGREGNRLDPQGTATRAEVATMLMRYLDNIK